MSKKEELDIPILENEETWAQRVIDETNDMAMKADGTLKTCGCGRSPTGQCCGWHGLSEDAYQRALAEYEKAQSDDVATGEGCITTRNDGC